MTVRELSEPHRRRSSAWTPALSPADYTLGHVRAVLPDRIVDDARIVVRDGLLAEVGPHPAGTCADVDGQGLLCVPGLIDVHSDGLEKERLPRPGAELPFEFALISFEAKLRAAGLTTVFHGAGFEESLGRGLARTISNARAVCAVIDARRTQPDALVDHRILYRLDVRCDTGLAALRERLAATDEPGVPLVSHEDHTPGQGQYADRRYYERHLVGARNMTPEQAAAHVTELMAERAGQIDVRDQVLDWLASRARPGLIRLLGHDPSDAREIAALAARGGAVAEFPLSLEAARTAREHDMPVVMGAPNVLRGGSHNGNASAADLVAAGLVTALASDYLPSGLLASIFMLADSGVIELPAAIRLVTAGAASVAGLTDRGRLAAGQRADLVLVDAGHRWPIVRSVLTTGDTGPAGDTRRGRHR